MLLTNKALRVMRDSNAAAATELDKVTEPNDKQRAAFVRHRQREVWARERIAVRAQQQWDAGLSR